ncbi:MAG: aminoglycoside phosphotransferase family protein [Alphaproteobacteria bacterium]|nr:phosphotransferase [Alphaproteobacteria bacterium]MDE2113183.1 aminoglycoside phosphotransferase family protein [Alphaproteobacteria bacterium]
MNLNDGEVRSSLHDMGLIANDESCVIQPLSGGVSCDVFMVETARRRFCVKRALPKLRVAADWRAPADRSHAEVAWMEFAAAIEPKWAPRILGEDRARHLFAMQFFPPDDYPVWKSLLAAGRIDAEFAALVGGAIARIHAATAGREDIARAFANGEQFHALRVDAYLLHTAAAHPDVAEIVRAAAQGVETARIALMHGDVSPKNILCGPDGPVFLDAETCCYGDPAFDLAFCLNHLLLKGVWRPDHAAAYAAAFTALKDAYFAKADWETPDGLERRTARLLSAFLLARIDGKSPVEYIASVRDKDFVRTQAKTFLRGSLSLGEMLARWTQALPALQMR